jgi:hypothetical protein
VPRHNGVGVASRTAAAYDSRLNANGIPLPEIRPVKFIWIDSGHSVEERDILSRRHVVLANLVGVANGAESIGIWSVARIADSDQGNVEKCSQSAG